MLYRHGLWVLIVVVLVAASVSAARRPSFYLDYSAWKATHIVVATEGAAIDGKLEVIESWKGDLTPGSQITVPALAAFADQDKRRVDWHHLRDLPEPFVRSVTADKMVLFLIRVIDPSPVVHSAATPGLWQPASQFGDFGTSIAWIERGEAYMYVQTVNPGPSRIIHDGTAITMRIRTTCLTQLQSELTIAIRENDPIRTVQVFRTCRHYDFFAGATESIRAMGNMGERSLGICALLHDITTAPWHSDIISAMVKAGGQAVSSDLIGVMEEELSFWSEQTPSLKDGWWNDDPDGQRQTRRLHYERLLQTLRSLAVLTEAPDRGVIVKTRDLWQTTPALASVGDGQIVKACNALF